MARRASSPAEVGAEWAELLRLLPGYDPFHQAGPAWFDAEAASAAIEFIEECIHHVEGDKAGEPLLLERWQKALVGNLFGWFKEDRLGRVVRRYKEVLLYVPRKNGKTPLAAAIALYVLFCDPEIGQQNYISAATKPQAGMLFRQARGMIELEPELSSRVSIFGGKAEAGQSRSIIRNRDNSFLRVVSADAVGGHGGNSHLSVIDELHAQPSREFVDVTTTSTASLNRKQTLTIYVTTADFNRHSICNEKYAYACSVRDGFRDDPGFLPAVFEALPEDDWTDPVVWRKANPNLGVSVSEEYLERECGKAKDNTAYENTFRRLHLNQRTETDTLAVRMDRWDRVTECVDAEEFLGLECFAGLDLSATTDLSAFVLLFSMEDRYAVLPFFWAPRERARERSLRDRVPYEQWAREGYLTLTEGDVIDYDQIRVDINQLTQRYNIREVAADRWNATQLITQLQGDGLNVLAFGQGYQSMTAPTKEFLALVQSGRLLHGGHPILRWMASVFATEQDAAGNLKPSKKKSTDRIDGVVALIMALGRAMVAPVGGSIYESQGLEVI